MKSLRERFEEEYAAVSVPADNKDGFRIKYVYYAPWYIWDLPEKELKEKKNCFLALSLLNMVLYLAAGIQDIAVNRTGIPLVFSAVVLCAQILEMSGVFRFRFTNYKTERMTWQSIHQILYFAPLAGAGGMLMLILANIQEILRGAVDIPQMIALLSELAYTVISAFLFLEYRKIPFRTEKNNSIEGQQLL